MTPPSCWQLSLLATTDPSLFPPWKPCDPPTPKSSSPEVTNDKDGSLSAIVTWIWFPSRIEIAFIFKRIAKEKPVVVKKINLERGIRNPKDYYTRLKLSTLLKKNSKTKKKKQQNRTVDYVELNSGSSKSRGVFWHCYSSHLRYD